MTSIVRVRASTPTCQPYNVATIYQSPLSRRFRRVFDSYNLHVPPLFLLHALASEGDVSSRAALAARFESFCCLQRMGDPIIDAPYRNIDIENTSQKSLPDDSTK